MKVLFAFVFIGTLAVSNAFSQKKSPEDSIKIHLQSGNTGKAIGLARENTIQIKKKKGEKSVKYAKAIELLASSFFSAGQLDSAVFYGNQQLAVLTNKLGENSLDLTPVLINLGVSYKNQGDFAKAIPLFEKAYHIRTSRLPSGHPDIGLAALKLGDSYNKTYEWKKAEPLLELSVTVLSQNPAASGPNLAEAFHNYGLNCMNQDKFELAETNFKKAIDLQKKEPLSPKNPLGYYINNLGNLYFDIPKLEKAKATYQEALASKRLNKNSKQTILSSMGNIATTNQRMGNYAEAEQNYLEMQEEGKKVFGEISYFMAGICGNMGALYLYKDELEKSEFYSLKSVEIIKKLFGESHFELSKSYSILGSVYFDIGNMQRSEEYYQKAIDIIIKKHGPEHSSLVNPYGNLSLVHFENGKIEKAKKSILQSMAIVRKTKGDKNAELGNMYVKMANLLEANGEFNNLENTLNMGHQIIMENYPEFTRERAEAYSALGSLYLKTGQNEKADAFLQKEFAVRRRLNRPDHLKRIHLNFKYGQLKYHEGKLDSAVKYLTEGNKDLKIQIVKSFSLLTEREKANSFKSNLEKDLHLFTSFCFANCSRFPDLRDEQYNNALLTKAILLNASQKFKQRLRSSSDTNVKREFQKWEKLKERITKFSQSSDSNEIQLVYRLEEEANGIEKTLGRISKDFSNLTDGRLVSWKDIQAKLRTGEAAIEMIRFRKYGIWKKLIDTSDLNKPLYPVKGLSDTIQYAALILKPGSLHPELVLLPNGNDLEDKWITYYKSKITRNQQDLVSYNQFWSRINKQLGREVHRVYFSPDGVYSSINLNTLYNPSTKKYLVDELDVKLVTNTKDILAEGAGFQNESLACLVGNPDFNVGKEKRAEIFRSDRGAKPETYTLHLVRNEGFQDLPGTKVEIENIGRIFQSNGWKLESLTGEKALEESVKELQKPRVLHFATHGFFQPDSGKTRNPLINSGLILSGANKSLAGEKDEKVEDGILTAYEAMNLNLDNTDLVVLSACETGLGEIKNGEGVYGLQRAFKVAGAKTIVMSLWKVNDKATQELMLGFYKHWLGLQTLPEEVKANSTLVKGASSHRADNAKRQISKWQAFMKAQKDLKAKYPDPYYWGAFVMVGD